MRRSARTKEDRSKKRVAISRAVRLRCENWSQFRTDFAENISEGGIFIHTAEPLSPGTLFFIEMSVADEKFSGQAQVIWTKEFSPREARVSGMGARFVGLSDVGKAIIRKWIDQAMQE